MARDDERLARAQEEPIVGGLPDVPGHPGRDPPDARASASTCAGSPTSCSSTTSRAPRSTAPSARCSRRPSRPRTTASSAWIRTARSRRAVIEQTGATDRVPLIDTIKVGSSDGFDAKMRALLHISRTVRRRPRDLTAADVAAAHAAGATDADVQLAVLIAAAFSMYNRMVDGFRARTPPSARGLPRPRRRDRGARLQRPAGHVGSALGTPTDDWRQASDGQASATDAGATRLYSASLPRRARRAMPPDRSRQ